MGKFWCSRLGKRPFPLQVREETAVFFVHCLQRFFSQAVWYLLGAIAGRRFIPLRFIPNKVDQLIHRGKPLLFAGVWILQRSAPGHPFLFAPEA